MIEFLIYLLTMAGIWGLLSISLNLQYGLAGLVNLGHVAFFMLGAYGSTMLVVLAGAPILVGMIGGVILAGTFGMLMALPTTKLQQDYWGISTLAAAEIVRIFFLNTAFGDPYTGQAFGFDSIPRPFRSSFATLDQYNLFYMTLVLVVLGLVLAGAMWLARTPFGRTLKAIREGDEVPLALGKRTAGFRLRAMAIGGAIAGLAGALFAHYNAQINPEYFLPLETFLVWAMVILGGAGNFIGAVLGTFIVMALYNSTRFVAPLLNIEPQLLGPLRMIAIGVLIILIILYMPKGLLPERKARLDR